MQFDTIIKNGTILDGISAEPHSADVGISGKEIKAIGNLSSARAKQIISADHKFVCPGFIDIQNHSDSYFTLLEIPAMPSLTSQGVTTIAVGQCGTSLAPLPNIEAIKSVQKWHSLAGANLNWLTFGEYFDSLKRYPLGVNVTSLIGHSTLRRGLVGDKVRPATPEEISIMSKLLSDGLSAGAAGMSLGLAYAHEANSTIEEMTEAATVVAKHKKLLSIHLRSEGAHVVESVDEAIDLAERARASLEISHFKVRGEKNWPKLEAAMARIDRAYQRGVNVSFDVYPYTTSWTVAYTYLPKWAYEGGRSAILENLQDPVSRRKILAYLKDQEEKSIGNMMIASSSTNPSFVGKTLRQIAANQEVGVEEALVNVIAGTNSQAVVFDLNISEESLPALLAHPLSLIASDGAGYDFVYSASHGLVHPRCFGAFPKFLGLVRDKKVKISWSEAVKKITSRAADKLGVGKRGRLTVGNFADIVVFDPRDIDSRATYESPYQESDGIDYVLINGKLVFWETLTGETAGEVLRV